MPITKPPQVVIDHAALNLAVTPFLMNGLEAIGNRAVDEIKADLDTPVERDFSGAVVGRSPAGSPPYREHGILQAHVEANVVAKNVVTNLPFLRVEASRPPEGGDDQPDAAVVLEFGGTNQDGKFVAARPFMGPAKLRIEDYAGEMLQEAANKTVNQ